MCFFVCTSCAPLRQPGGASATTFGQDLHPRSLGHPQGVSTLHRGGVSGGPSDQKRTRQQIIRELSPGVIFKLYDLLLLLQLRMLDVLGCYVCSSSAQLGACGSPLLYIFLFLLRRTPLRNRLKWRISCTAKWSRSHGAFWAVALQPFLGVNLGDTLTPVEL